MINRINKNIIEGSLITKQNRTTITCDGQFLPTYLNEDSSPVTKISPTIFQYSTQMLYVEKKCSLIRTFDEFTTTITKYEKICIENFKIINNNTLCECITHKKKLIICTDGSYKPHSSGGATIITDENETILVSGFNPDTGNQWFQCSYRSECQACLSAYIFLKNYCEYINQPIPASIYYSDNKGLIQKISSGLKIAKQTTSKDII